MTSSENLESWNLKATTFTDSWLSEAFTRDTHTITRALEKTFSDMGQNSDPFYPLYNMINPETTSVLPTPSVSGSDPDTPRPKPKTAISNGKITKRKSRASKRNTTTFINADPANFRQMVQQVTGIRFNNGQLPVTKPEPQRAANRFQGCLPTLDTSAFLLDHHHQVASSTATTAMVPATGYIPVANGGAPFDFESFSGFPTLESWKVM